MATRHIIRRVSQKEVRLFFASPVAWLFLASFAGFTLFVFFWVESFFARNIADIRPLFQWMPILLIFLCAALTMRMWSEERRTGTLEHVLTLPVNPWYFVLGKFRACIIILSLALLSTLPLPITVAAIAELDWGPVLAGYLATLLMGAAYISAGLFVSARTDNPIVSLMGSVALCGALYLIGSGTLTSFFDNRVGDILRTLGSGSRFESITRGVVDVRDLFYYISITLGFLTLNVYVLEKERWASAVSTPRHRRWRVATLLVLANLAVANIWLHTVDQLRLDLTEGKLYSISEPTHELLEQLQEPLLIRGYFSAKTHPMLAPLIPQLRDLLKEYQLAGDGNVRVEFVDPASSPELEEEANKRFGIHATPFQVADRYQAALVNSYFNILVQYGNEYETLGFTDLIEVRTAANSQAEVLLRNPEYDISRAIKDVLYSYRMGGKLFDAIRSPVEFIGYVSADDLLPDQLLAYQAAISAQMAEMASLSEGKFSVRWLQPEAGDGTLARQIEEEWGFSPMVASLDQEREFYFYLTLADDHQVVQLPTDEFDATAFPANLHAGLKRFASGLTRTVALSVPPVSEQMAQYHLGGPTFSHLEQAITRNYSIQMEDLEDGSIAPEADILAVIAPHNMTDTAVFALDQFLMRGGTVVLATSPFTAEISDGELRLQDWDSGLQDWLAHHGISIAESLVLDKKSAPFPAPVSRQVGEYTFRDVQMLDYPYFIDIRKRGFARKHPITANLPQVTMAWASPITAELRDNRRLTTLLRSSPRSWRSADMDVMPSIDEQGRSKFRSQGEDRRRETLGVVSQGRFESFFNARPDALEATRQGGNAGVNSVLSRSAESARLVVFSSNDFMDDQILNAVVTGSGTQYLGSVELFLNTLDWALQDEQLLEIRSSAHFNRTLPPMETRDQARIEYFNYLLIVAWLGILALGHRAARWRRKRRYRKELAA